MREAKAEARKEEDRKLLRKFLIDPEAYEGRVRARLAAMEERKHKYGHRKGDYHLVVALVVNFALFWNLVQTPSEILRLHANFFLPISGLHQYICLHIPRNPKRKLMRYWPIHA